MFKSQMFVTTINSLKIVDCLSNLQYVKLNLYEEKLRSLKYYELSRSCVDERKCLEQLIDKL